MSVFSWRDCVCNIYHAVIIKKISFLLLFRVFFYWKISKLCIFLKSSSIVIIESPELRCFQLSHICYAGYGWVQVFWLSQFKKYFPSPLLLKCYTMFFEYLRIIEDDFYFKGMILLTCPKKNTAHIGFHSKSSNFHYVVMYIKICEIYWRKPLHCSISAFESLLYHFCTARFSMILLLFIKS